MKKVDQHGVKSTQINVRISPTLKKQFQQICLAEHRSQAEQIAYWIETQAIRKVNFAE